MSTAKIDDNSRASLSGINEVTGLVQPLLVDDTTGALLITGTLSVGNLNDIGDVNVGTPGAGEDGYVLTWDNGTSKFILTGAGAGDVTAGANLGDNLLIRGDGASKGVQNSGISIDDTDNITGVLQLTVGNTGLVVGASTPFSDTAGTLTLQNIDAIDATTEATLESAIDSLVNLVTVGTIGTGVWQGTAITDTYISSAATWNAKQDALTFGIADTNAVDIDSASVASGEYAKFTVNGLESKSFSEVKTDLSLNNVENTAISTWAGSSNITTVGTVASGNVDSAVTDATKTAKGKVELATTAEIDTGTDSTRAMPVDQYKASKRNIRWLVFNLVEAGTDCAVATNIAGDFVSPIAGTILQNDSTPFYLYATNSTAGTTGTMVVDVSIGGTSIMTTNKLDFDTTEKTTTTASTPPDLTTTSLSVGDIITIDIDSIHDGTAAKGLTVYLAVRE